MKVTNWVIIFIWMLPQLVNAQDTSSVSIYPSQKYYKQIYSRTIDTTLKRIRQFSENTIGVNLPTIMPFEDYIIYPIAKTNIQFKGDTGIVGNYISVVRDLIIVSEPVNDQIFTYIINTQSLGLLGGFRGNNYSKFIKKAGNQKSFLFFTYFLDKDSTLNNTAAIYNPETHSINYYNETRDIFVDLKDYLTDHFGSIGNFRSQKNYADSLMTYSKAAASYDTSAIDKYICRNWIFSVKFLPQDTGSAIKHLVADIGLAAHLNKAAKLNLSKELATALHSPISAPTNLNDIFFYNIDLNRFLKFKITPEQYQYCIRKWTIDNIRYRYIANYIYLNKVPNFSSIQQKSDAYNQYIRNLIITDNNSTTTEN